LEVVEHFLQSRFLLVFPSRRTSLFLSCHPELLRLLSKHLQFIPVGRAAGELLSEGEQLKPVPALKFAFAYEMLLRMMIGTQADDPSVGRLEAHSPVRADPHVRALDAS
jgi:hypothetical protein